MKRACILYATREGQTKKVAQYVASTLSAAGIDSVDIRDVKDSGDDIYVGDYAAMIVAASVHLGEHEPEIIDFVKTHRYGLEKVPTAFISVSLSEAGAERVSATAAQHVRFAADVQKVLNRFFQQTGWTPSAVMPVAGALPYSKYNWLIRFVMKRIASKAGGDTDTSRDYEYTDWPALGRFITEFAVMSSRTNRGTPVSSSPVVV
jgi:menaquinone-dependent protoporphyrinogen oxidase